MYKCIHSNGHLISQKSSCYTFYYMHRLQTRHLRICGFHLGPQILNKAISSKNKIARSASAITPRSFFFATPLALRQKMCQPHHVLDQLTHPPHPLSPPIACDTTSPSSFFNGVLQSALVAANGVGNCRGPGGVWRRKIFSKVRSPLQCHKGERSQNL